MSCSISSHPIVFCIESCMIFSIAEFKTPSYLKLSGLEAFSFDYDVKWPLSLILNRKVFSFDLFCCYFSSLKLRVELTLYPILMTHACPW